MPTPLKVYSSRAYKPAKRERFFFSKGSNELLRFITWKEAKHFPNMCLAHRTLQHALQNYQKYLKSQNYFIRKMRLSEKARKTEKN